MWVWFGVSEIAANTQWYPHIKDDLRLDFLFGGYTIRLTLRWGGDHFIWSYLWKMFGR